MVIQAKQTQEEFWQSLIIDRRKWNETLLVVEDKQRRRVPFIYNNIQNMAYDSQTGMDIWVKPSSVGFSTERIATRLGDTLTHPGTNTVLVAYEDFITSRLLGKVNFFFNHLSQLNIPNFPEIHNDSEFQKTFRFYIDGKMIGTSSMYIASARSKTAGRAEVIHHLLLDEHAFYVPEATERIIAPAMARVPPEGTVDSLSTPNGEDNEFHEWYVKAKEGHSLFTAHFYPWFAHEEYRIQVGDPRLKQFPECDKPEFILTGDEEKLMFTHSLTFDQIRWRRWMQLVMESLRRKGETRTLFTQEFPEDDVTCFLSTGDMWFEHDWMEKVAKTCYDAPTKYGDLNVWFPPEKGKHYLVVIDPGQGKITQTAIGVLSFGRDALGNIIPTWCARDSGWYPPDEVTTGKATKISDYYNRAEICWEANSHGLAISALLKHRRPIYFRKDIVADIPTLTPGWLTTSRTKDYMLQQVGKYLPNLICHDIELVRQMRNLRKVQGKLEIIGLDDVLMAFAMGLSVYDPNPVKRGLQGQTGYKQNWGRRKVHA